MKIDFNCAVTRLGENQWGVAVTAVVPTADQAIEIRNWLQGALKTAAGSKPFQKGNNLILPANWSNGR